jgi:hypothetical protein
LVAETFIHFFNPQASVSWPSTMNFWHFGSLDCWLRHPPAHITEFGGFICHLSLTVCTVVMVCGVGYDDLPLELLPGFKS